MPTCHACPTCHVCHPCHACHPYSPTHMPHSSEEEVIAHTAIWHDCLVPMQAKGIPDFTPGGAIQLGKDEVERVDAGHYESDKWTWAGAADGRGNGGPGISHGGGLDWLDGASWHWH